MVPRVEKSKSQTLACRRLWMMTTTGWTEWTSHHREQAPTGKTHTYIHSVGLGSNTINIPGCLKITKVSVSLPSEKSCRTMCAYQCDEGRLKRPNGQIDLNERAHLFCQSRASQHDSPRLCTCEQPSCLVVLLKHYQLNSTHYSSRTGSTLSEWQNNTFAFAARLNILL